MKNVLTTMLLISALLLSSAAVWATTVVQLDFDQLVEASDLIVVGHVTGVEARLREGRVFTHVEVKVAETLKGESRQTLEIVHIGGRTDKLVTLVHGMPSFRVGEHALLFLEQPKSVDHFVVTGLAQGKMPLHQHRDGSLTLTRQPKRSHDHALPSADVDATRTKTSIPTPRITTLDEARVRIAELLDAKTEKTVR